MFNQSYINIFINSGGNITLAYAIQENEDDALNLGEVQIISLSPYDAHTIAKALIDTANSVEDE